MIALAAASSSLAGTCRPTLTSVLPWLVRTPAELASANVVATILENSGALAGPVVAGGAAAAALVRVTRLGRSFVTGVLLWGLSLAVLALAPSAALAYLVLIVVGLGSAVADVAVFTRVPRLVSPRVGGQIGTAKQ